MRSRTEKARKEFLNCCRSPPSLSSINFLTSYNMQQHSEERYDKHSHP
jgi:hypothetical protein